MKILIWDISKNKGNGTWYFHVSQNPSKQKVHKIISSVVNEEDEIKDG